MKTMNTFSIVDEILDLFDSLRKILNQDWFLI